MNAIRFTTAAVCACVLAAAGPLSSRLAAGGLDDDDVTLKGCLVKGEGDGAGYLLTNTSGDPGMQQSADATIHPGTVGTTGGFASIFYWLDGDGDLEKNIGHQVEISGELKGDLKDGQIEMDRKDNWTEMTVKADGRTMKANVPNASLLPAPRESKEQKARVLVRKVDVDKVQMLAATCDMP
jgi:hypothetical protein